MVDGFVLMAEVLGDTVIRDNWTDPVDLKCFIPDLDHWAEGRNVREHQLEVRSVSVCCFVLERVHEEDTRLRRVGTSWFLNTGTECSLARYFSQTQNSTDRVILPQ